MDVIRDDVARTLREHGYGEVRVRTVLAPAWTTDWMSAEGRPSSPTTASPRRAGGRPARCRSSSPPARPSRCPARTAAPTDTREVSRFGSTACKAHHTCRACLEPFDHFKPL